MLSLTDPKSRRARPLAVAVLLSWFFFTALHGAESAPIHFHVPAGEASATLKQFANQAKREIMFPAQPVGSIRTNTVDGDLTVTEALARMLAGTPLKAVEDAKTGAIVVKRDELPNVSRAAQIPASDRPRAKTDGTAIQLEQVEVTGSRIRSLVGEQTTQPTFTLDRKDIERTGVTKFGDLFRYIPAITSSNNGAPATPGNANPYSVTAAGTQLTATLHGFPVGATLILVDGRRVNKTSQANTVPTYDVIGLPLSAIERVEVVLDGASAIYGADAVAGVINIITRKEYHGTELRFGYDNLFRTDAAQRSVSLMHGFSTGKWRGQIAVSYEDNTRLAARDLFYSASSDRRPFGGTDDRLNSSYVEGTGYVQTTNGTNLPGLSSSRAAIPVNSDGKTVTVADYANAGAIGAPFDAGRYYVQPQTQTRTGSFSLEYAARPWLVPFVQGRAAHATTRGDTDNHFYTTNSLTLPAGYPGNPFGVPIVAVKVFYDEVPENFVVRTDSDLAFGLRGALPHDWKYESSVDVERSVVDQAGNYTSLNGALAQAAVNSANPPVLLYDSTRRTDPNPPGTYDAIASNIASNRELPVSWIYTAQADGPVLNLPAGEIRVAAGIEEREEYVDFVNIFSLFAPTQFVNVNRRSLAEFAEIRVPVVSQRQGWSFLHQVSLSAAVRHDDYNHEGKATSPSAGIIVQPFKWLLFRANYSEGFKVPDLSSRYRLSSGINVATTNVTRYDPLRGNEVLKPPYLQVSKGNPYLMPETSRSRTIGLAVEVPFVKGLSFSADAWRTDYNNRIVSLLSAYTYPQAIVAHPELFVRGPNRAGDAAGWPGPIVEADTTVSINAGISDLGGWDAGMRYDRPTPWGSFTLRIDIAKTTDNEIRVSPAAAPSTSTGTFNLPPQLSGSLFWNKGAIETGVLSTYRGASRSSVFSNLTPSAIRWDWQASYNFDQSSWARGSGRRWQSSLLNGTSISVTVFNIFDRDPPQDGTGIFDFSVIDSRLQHYSLQLTKRF